jgi:hypothetical protein
MRADDLTQDPRFHGHSPFGLRAGGRRRPSAGAQLPGGAGGRALRRGAGHHVLRPSRTGRCSANVPSASCAALPPRPRWRSTTHACTKPPSRPPRSARCCSRANALARAEAERTSQMKDEFLATLSHELRTPLSAILGWAQVLRRGGRDQNDLQRKGLQTIERNARAQAQLIEDLLDMSRITSGKVLLDMQVVTPAGFVDAAIETVRPAADAKNIRIEKHYAARSRHDRRRPGAPAAGRVEPAVERDQVHAARRPGRDRSWPATTPTSSDHRARQRRRHQARIHYPRVRALPPGRCLDDAAPRRPGPGPGHRQAPDRAAWRHRARRQPGRRPRRQLHDRTAAGQAAAGAEPLGARRHDPGTPNPARRT